MKGNNIRQYLYSVFTSLILLFTSGSIIQTFFYEIGFSVSQISIYSALTTAVQTIMMILNIFIADKIKQVRKITGYFNLAPIILLSVMLVFCFIKDVDVNFAFTITMVACTALNLFQGISGVLVYRLAYLVLDMDDYARITNVCSIFIGIFSIGASFIIVALSAIFDYNLIMIYGFGISIIFSVGSCISILSMKENAINDSPAAEEFALDKLKKKVFTYFYFPNFIRGLSMSVMNVIAVLCIKAVTDDQAYLSGLVTIFAVAGIGGSVLYNVVIKKFSTANIYMLSGLFMLVLLPLMVVGASPVVFGVCYFVAGMFYTIANNSAAVYATEIVDYYDMGTFTSSRLILIYIGQTVGSLIISAIIDTVPTILILLGGGLMQFVSGVFSHLWEVKFSKNQIKEI